MKGCVSLVITDVQIFGQINQDLERERIEKRKRKKEIKEIKEKKKKREKNQVRRCPS